MDAVLSAAAVPAPRVHTQHLVLRVLAGLAAVGYVAARAILVPLTYDEVSSLRNYVTGQPENLLDFAVATNHLLNSVLMRASVAVFGDAPWALRLPNILAAAAYAAAAAGFAGRLRHPLAGTGACVLLLSNLYVLDFFGLARGYGLASALFFGAVVVLTAWWDRPLGDRRRLALALVLAGAGVAANFGTLFGFVAIVATAALRLAVVTRRASASAAAWVAVPRRGAAVAAMLWLLLALVYSSVVFSRARVLSPDLVVPTTVHIAGLFEDELAAIQIYRADSTGRLRPLQRSGATWTSGAARDVRTLRVSLSAFAAANLGGIEVAAGTHRYAFTPGSPGPWRIDRVGVERVLVFTAPLDWHGGAAHTRLAMRHGAAITALLALLGVLLTVLVGAAARARVVAAADGRLLVQAILGAATVVAAPIYLLQRDGQLFFGGQTGLIPDTFGTLVSGTLYGAAEHPRAGLFGLMALGALLFVVAGLSVATTRLRGGAPAAAAVVLAVLGLAAVQAEALHQLLGSPYPMARTAVFLLPLLLVLPALAAEAAGTLSPRTAGIAGGVVLSVAAASVWHATRVANLTSARDWPDDAVAVEMVALVARTAGHPPAAGAMVRLGVDWMYFPVVDYYAGRPGPEGARLDTVVLPGDGPPVQFVYVRPSSEFAVGDVVQRYPESGAVLRRTGARPVP